MNLTKLRRKLFLKPSDFTDIYKGLNFNSEKEFEDLIISKLPEILDIPEDRIKRQYHLTQFNYDKSQKCDIAILSRWNKDQVVLILELKLEKWFEKYHESYERGLEYAERELSNYCQMGRVNFGILLTDKDCYFREYSFKNSSKVKAKDRLKLLFNYEVIDPRPNLLNFMIGIILGFILLSLFFTFILLQLR